MNDITLSLIVPVYNAEQTLVSFIEQCLAVLPTHVADYEIIIVNDKSNDTTATIADNLAALYDPILIIHQPRRRGYGRALLAGAAVARGDYILIADTAGHIDFSQIDALLPYTLRYDIVIGYPHQARLSWLQRMTDSIVNRLFDLDLQATAHSFVLVRTELLQHQTFMSQSLLVLVELYANARENEYLCIQTGIEQRGQAAVVPGPGYARADLPAFGEMFHLWMHMHTTRDNTSIPWIQRAVVAGVLIFVARSIWLLLRRRTP